MLSVYPMEFIKRTLQPALTALCAMSILLSVFGVPPSGQFWGIGAVLFGSYFAIKSAWESLVERNLDVNFLMLAAAVGSVILGHILEAAVLLFLFSLSSTLESLAMSRTKSAIEGLIKLRPETALRMGDGQDESVPVAALRVGDRVRVLPFEHIPTDGILLGDAASVDQHAMTGESIPVDKTAGDPLLAGTQNLDRMIVMEVTVEPGDTTLEKIVDLVRDAQENKASGEKISSWFGQKYTVFVLFAFLISLGIRLATGQAMEPAAYAALTLFVALSPCALVISTPATTLSALAWAARQGILIRGGEFIEAAGTIDTLAVDKTGTLTRGKPELAEICVCTTVHDHVHASGSMCVDDEACWTGGPTISLEAKDLLRAAAAAEQYSTHPIAQAIVTRAKEFGLDIPEATQVQSVPGLGVIVDLDGETVKIGQRRFFEQNGESLAPDFAVHAEELQSKGMTVAILDFGGRMAALGIADQLRPEAPNVLQQLRTLGIKNMVMLTGDTPETAGAVAAHVSIDSVHAGLFPDDKARIIKGLVDQGSRVMMVGDGVNDAPSLSACQVGVAMGGLGSDIALNAADVVLMNDRLDRLPQLLRLGRTTQKIIRANLIFAGSMVIFLAISTFVVDMVAPQYRSMLLPFAVVGHEGSTVLVILNGLRLLKGP